MSDAAAGAGRGHLSVQRPITSGCANTKKAEGDPTKYGLQLHFSAQKQCCPPPYPQDPQASRHARICTWNPSIICARLVIYIECLISSFRFAERDIARVFFYGELPTSPVRGRVARKLLPRHSSGDLATLMEKAAHSTRDSGKGDRWVVSCPPACVAYLMTVLVNMKRKGCPGIRIPVELLRSELG